MAVTNSEIAAIFSRIGDLLEIQGENPFRVRAYRNAARMVRGLSRSLAEMVEQGEVLEALPTIGKDLAAKIREIVATGSLRKLTELETTVSPGLVDLLQVPGLGPKRLKILRDYLKYPRCRGTGEGRPAGTGAPVAWFRCENRAEYPA
ncbi:hypothetical protein [Thiolapillus sp.]|uniref:hypothetical protein n=1 Tax=Thiolapillus sp. TaxID=2017437 RepID=UPI003AF8E8C2